MTELTARCLALVAAPSVVGLIANHMLGGWWSLLIGAPGGLFAGAAAGTELRDYLHRGEA